MSNGFEPRKTTLGRDINRKEGRDPTSDEELIDALRGWNGKTACMIGFPDDGHETPLPIEETVTMPLFLN
uniref:Uncharacterized protein n=1 Tax=Candidatus Kentrum sp. TC TaxID=2126339 RepID=A0A451AAJ6_9GAMM|nr:MAG: hypothetical protein BECKTC1821D_GA0114238_11239 [Candidatus Kentron sp. TC]VFK63059.1 MAG: hypothetical protein BECKTC1821F_GA0114240_10855 [Candidatus Kentron sp. TC]